MRSLIVGMSVAVVASTAHAVSYTWPADTSGGLRFEGDTYAVSQTSGTISNGGTIVITNATVDAWMADANRVAFANGNSGTVNIDAGGMLRVYSCVNDGIINLNPGGTLVLEKFTKPSSGTGRINANGGRIVFKNVSKPSTYCWFENYSQYPSGWCINVLGGGLVISNVVGNADGHMPPIKSGTLSDGGVTYEGVGTISLYDNDHTFNGGVHICKSGVFRPFGDNCFGNVPEGAMDNIFWNGSGSMLGAIEIARNRSIAIASGATFVAGSTSSMRILGTIGGDESTCVSASGTWNGALVLSPGEGRTNRVGRLQVDGRLVLESGTTVVNVQPPSGNTDYAKSAVGIKGNNSAYNDNKGVFEVNGGELRCEGSGYVPLSQYGQLIVSDGVCDFSINNQEILNGFGSPSRSIVRNGGELRCFTFRLSQNTVVVNDDIPTRLSVETGGVVRCANFSIGNASTSVCCIDFNGGTLKGFRNWNNFLGNADTEWQHVFAYVHEGGATFDSDVYDIGVHLPLRSAVADDGGLTKKGDGILTLSKANSYNGPTRVLGGTIVFSASRGFPGGDVEIDGEMLADRLPTSHCLIAPDVAFRSGSTIRVLVPSGFDVSRLNAWHKIVGSKELITGDLPSVEVVDAETKAPVICSVHVRLDAGGKAVSIKASHRGFAIIYR